jgi:deazaflavin-dependent oxidoreductase (nitroreductase family)
VPDGTNTELDLSLYGAEHIRRYRETNGEVGYLWNGVPTLILTSTGRRTGQKRDSALICGSYGDGYVVIASQAGAPTHPLWYLNLRDDPRVEVQVLGDRFAATARTAEGGERQRLWSMMTDAWPNYDVYQSRTDRTIPLVVLDRD